MHTHRNYTEIIQKNIIFFRHISDKENDTKNDKRQNDKIKKEQARILVEEGHTLKETSTKLNINENTLRTYSAKKKWQKNIKKEGTGIFFH